jgi:hypothetical protein
MSWVDTTKPFTLHLEDESELVLRWEGDQLVSEHRGHGPEPVGPGPLRVVWVALSGRQGVPRLRVIFICDPVRDASRVVLDSPYIKGEILQPLPDDRRIAPRPWPPSLQLFRPGEVVARWQVKGRREWRTIAEQRLLIEEWGYVAGDSGLRERGANRVVPAKRHKLDGTV